MYVESRGTGGRLVYDYPDALCLAGLSTEFSMCHRPFEAGQGQRKHVGSGEHTDFALAQELPRWFWFVRPLVTGVWLR